jgi:adenine-specific DNA-methyltransferase
MTELTWDGKYDEHGNKTAALRVSLPFQTVETVNESAQERQIALDLFSAGRDSAWRNRLIWGDKKYVLPSLLDELGGRVNLIYIDPPFNVGADFSFIATVPSSDDDDAEGPTFTKEASVIEQKAYRDTWGRGLDSYLQWFYETALLLRELLADDGSIYIHLDDHVSSYAKAILDEVFGHENFLNEIVWQRTGAHNDPRRYGNIADTLLFYAKTTTYSWNVQYSQYSDDYIKERFRSVEEASGRRYWLNTLTAPSHGRPTKPAIFFGQQKAPPAGTMWRFTQEKITELEKQNRIVVTASSGMPYIKQYLDESPGRPLQSIWSDIPMSKSGFERTGYATQKPEALLDRILKVSSNESDLVLDCFCGSGTTAVVAEKLNRRWIACDLGRFAVHTTRKRLLSIPNVRPFVVQNLGKYERQAWQVTEFGPEADASRREKAALQQAYIGFILKLYKAQPITGYTWLHGLRGGRMVHVGAVDAPISLGDIAQILAEFKKAVGTAKAGERGELTEARPTANSVDVLGWDFAFEINEVAKQHAQAAKVNLRFQRIPRDVMDKRAVEQGDIHFFELAALSVDVEQKKRDVALNLADFVIPPDDVPEDVQRAIKHWSQWIDYWAVDWDYRDDTFHNQWQTYRTRQSPELERSASHTYEDPGAYTIVVKVIDILGNDTTKALMVKVK